MNWLPLLQSEWIRKKIKKVIKIYIHVSERRQVKYNNTWACIWVLNTFCISVMQRFLIWVSVLCFMVLAYLFCSQSQQLIFLWCGWTKDITSPAHTDNHQCLMIPLLKMLQMFSVSLLWCCYSTAIGCFQITKFSRVMWVLLIVPICWCKLDTLLMICFTLIKRLLSCSSVLNSSSYGCCLDYSITNYPNLVLLRTLILWLLMRTFQFSLKPLRIANVTGTSKSIITMNQITI